MASQTSASPIGTPARDGATRRADRSAAYRGARQEYDAIAELRAKNPLAAHIRERRFELDLTQQQVADQAGTSHSAISRLEKGDSWPTIAVLRRILAVLDEDLELRITPRGTDGDDTGASTIAVPDLATA